jgi:CRISPR-associated protein Csx16
MAVWLVTRHTGAKDWLLAQGINADFQVSHLDPKALAEGDDVVGVLPFHLAAWVCANGGKFLNLDIDIPAHLRGTELSADQLNALNARLTAYQVLAA